MGHGVMALSTALFPQITQKMVLATDHKGFASAPDTWPTKQTQGCTEVFDRGYHAWVRTQHAPGS